MKKTTNDSPKKYLTLSILSSSVSQSPNPKLPLPVAKITPVSFLKSQNIDLMDN